MTKTPPEPNLTPAMRQYQHFKQQYPEAILFFRMGDFYETFYEDAKTCSRVLGIALTSRGKNDRAIPLAGVPYHAVDSYLNKMIRAGYKVAVCEQVEDAAQAKGVVKRDVVRLVTPGTLTEEALLDERKGNFLAAVCFGPPCPAGAAAQAQAPVPTGLAWVELSTGQFFAEIVDQRELLDEIVRLAPAECLLSDDKDNLPEQFCRQLTEQLPAAITHRPGWVFDAQHAAEMLKKHFRTASLAGFGFEQPDRSIAAAGAIIEYLNETQKTALNHIARLRKVSQRQFCRLDQTTLRSLEIERTIRENAAAGTLLSCLDETCTAMGARRLRWWLCYPLNDLAHINRRQDAVAELVQLDTVRDELRRCLRNIADVERITTRISTQRASPRDVLSLGQTLRQLPAVRALLENCSSPLLTHLLARCETLDETADLIESAIDPEAPPAYRDGGVIRSGYDEQIDHLRSIGRDGQRWLADYQKTLIDRIGFPNLKVGFNKVFGYYVEISHAHRGELPADFVRKQTVKNAERYITDELKRYETEALTAEQRCRQLEQTLFQDVRRRIAQQTVALQQVAEALAELDVLVCLAHIARRRDYCRPRMHTDSDMTILDGRHPVLDTTLGSRFVPNDIALGTADGDLAIITGPNMSGKSTYIRQAALLVLMAQMGSFIPAKSAQIGLVDRIFTRVGASDELARGQSTFMVEMTETANIINNATERSLVILDEIGRGTSTYDGLALAWAITEHIATTIKCRTLFATHYHEITELADLLPNVKNYNVAVREWKDDVVFLHKIVSGRTDRSYGIHVAHLAGIPKPILRRSGEILEELESNFAREAHVAQIGGRLEAARPDGQLPLFDAVPLDTLREKLADVNPDTLTPIQALNLLQELKSELDGP